MTNERCIHAGSGLYPEPKYLSFCRIINVMEPVIDPLLLKSMMNFEFRNQKSESNLNKKIRNILHFGFAI